MLGVASVLGESLQIYRLLWRRSLLTAAAVYLVVDGLQTLELRMHLGAAHIGLASLNFLIGLAGPVLVQGALIIVVRDLHEARAARGMIANVRAALARIGSLTWIALVYSLGVTFGLLALVIPGLLAASRWSLMAPAVVLERKSGREARRRSPSLAGADH